MRRITPATVTIGVLFAFVALVAAYIVKDALRPREQPVPMVRDVMVAIDDFPADYVLTRQDIGRVDLPRSQVPSGTIMDRNELVGRRLKQPVKALTPLTAGLFYPPGGGPTLSQKLKPGYRAVSIEAQAAGGLGALIRPGDRVDVLLTVAGNDQMPELEGGATLTLLQGVEVLAVDSVLDRIVANPDAANFQNVTLAVTAEQANLLVLARDHGQLQVVMRSPEEEPTGPPPSRATLRKLLGLKPPVPEEPTEEEEEPKSFVAEIYRGSGRSTLEFDLTQQPARQIPGAGSVVSPPTKRSSTN